MEADVASRWSRPVEPPQPGWWLKTLSTAAWLLLLQLAACATPVQVDRADPRAVQRELTSDAISTGDLSEPTQIVLHRQDLSERFESDPEGAIAELHRTVTAGKPDPDALFALSEMSFHHAEDTGKPAYYLSAAVYAFAFLFPDDPAQRPNGFDPRFRTASDLYNRSLTSGFASADRSRVLLRSGRYELPFGTIDVTFDSATARWGNLSLVDFTPADELHIKGLQNRYRQRGIGAPLAADAPKRTEEKGFQIAPEVKVPVTALLRIDLSRVHSGRWADLVNDLQSDPVIRDHFQFWWFSYSTGNPTPFSALRLRMAIEDAVHELDPRGKDPALRQIVLIGHSQGGLIAKMLVIDSGSRLWNALSSEPLDELSVSPETRDLLRQAAFVTPVPEVRRVIFIATPQHGSFVAGSTIGQLLGRLVTLPAGIVTSLGEAVGGNPDAVRFSPGSAGFGSVWSMTPDNPALQALAAIPVSPKVEAHSIIAVEGDGPVETGDDGVVTYQSAHIDGVASELVVRSGHSVQGDPHTVAEVRRILLLHLAEACPQGCEPVSATDGPPLAGSPTGRVQHAAKGAPRRVWSMPVTDQVGELKR